MLRKEEREEGAEAGFVVGHKEVRFRGAEVALRNFSSLDRKLRTRVLDSVRLGPAVGKPMSWSLRGYCL